MKGAKLSSPRILIAIVLISIIGAGCAQQQQSALAPGKTLLTVDFQQGQTLRYKFLSSRDITVNWGQMKGASAGKEKVETSSESLEMVVNYTPVEVNPYGFSTIEAKCESAKVKRSYGSSRRGSKIDAAESFAGKSWTFTVGATGKIKDGSGFVEVLREAGAKAFRADRSQGLVKEPDMLYDITATQWFLWDSISSISNFAQGVAVGDEWQSMLHAPGPTILFAARNVTYRLGEIRSSEQGRIAVIDSSYTLRYPNPPEWPIPYTERFNLSGMFGFLRNYKLLDLQGEGEELFNIDAGRIEKSGQKYTMNATASLPMGLGINPKITINQTFTTELLAPAMAEEK